MYYASRSLRRLLPPTPPVPEALEMVLHENDRYNWSPEQSQNYVTWLDPDGDATGYLFRCLHCGTHLAYTDRS